jgi:hypothetical protein
MPSVLPRNGIAPEGAPAKGVSKNIRPEGLANEDPEWAALDSLEVTRFRFVVGAGFSRDAFRAVAQRHRP